MRILFVATLNSPHTARWISQLTNTDIDIHVFGNNMTVHPLLQGVTVHTPQTYWPFTRGGRYIRQIPGIKRLLFPELSQQLSHLIAKLQPDCIHSLKMQDEAYYVLAARKLLGNKLPCKWIYSSWGSDIYYYQHDPVHKPHIQEVLEAIDYYIPDCQRDIKLACEYGFRGKVLGVYPVTGAYPVDKMIALREQKPVSQRKIIALKGYQTYEAGRALTALEAIRCASDSIRDYSIIIHSAMVNWNAVNIAEVKTMAEKIAIAEGLSIEFMPFSPIEGIWALFGRSRISVGISATDGIPNTMLEAMTMGAFPIQSDTGAISEWIENGVNGLIVPHTDPDAIAAAIRQAAISDGLVDNASEINSQIVRSRLDSSIIVPQIQYLYKHL